MRRLFLPLLVVALAGCAESADEQEPQTAPHASPPGSSSAAEEAEDAPAPPNAETDDLRSPAILRSLEAWDAAESAARRRAAESVERRLEGFALDRLQRFSGGGHEHEIAVFVHAATGLEFSLLPGGTFRMGSPADEVGRAEDEGPQHTVTIARPFLMARTECTQVAWMLAGGDNHPAREGDDLPVEQVNWTEAADWCRGAGLRLPSEAEWEYACRAGTQTRFWSGDANPDLAQVGWYAGNSDMRTHPVGRKPPNAFGLLDVHGNVYEWCEDRWHDSYEGAPIDGSAWVDWSIVTRVGRGGAYALPAEKARSAFRLRSHRGLGLAILGFRPAASVPEE